MGAANAVKEKKTGIIFYRHAMRFSSSFVLLGLISGATATTPSSAHYLGPGGSSEHGGGPAYVSGTILLHFKQGPPPITDFSYDVNGWRGPQVELLLQPDHRVGEFKLLDLWGAHVDEGLHLVSTQFDVCVQQSATISLDLRMSQVQSLRITKEE